MAKPKVCVLRAPGTNCDVETAHAFEMCGGAAERVHLFRVLENPGTLDGYQVLCIPGGFSYGDDIGAGVIFSRELRGRLADAIAAFLRSDKLVLGICNGFQVLLKAGILPDGGEGWPADDESPPATLTWNDNGKYTAVWVKLRAVAPHNVFLRGIAELELPVAHAEGRLAVRDDSVLDRWRERGQIALRYQVRHDVRSGRTCAASVASSVADASKSPESGHYEHDVVLPFPDNPNGSVANIAGLSDPTGRVLGLMPHPERFIFATQHPQWTRRGLNGEGEGLKLFRNAVEYFGTDR